MSELKELLRPVNDKLSFDIQPWWEFDVTQIKQLIDCIQTWVNAQQSTITEVKQGQIILTKSDRCSDGNCSKYRDINGGCKVCGSPSF